MVFPVPGWASVSLTLPRLTFNTGDREVPAQEIRLTLFEPSEYRSNSKLLSEKGVMQPFFLIHIPLYHPRILPQRPYQTIPHNVIIPTPSSITPTNPIAKSIGTVDLIQICGSCIIKKKKI